jgi:hypothetical protein
MNERRILDETRGPIDRHRLDLCRAIQNPLNWGSQRHTEDPGELGGGGGPPVKSGLAEQIRWCASRLGSGITGWRYGHEIMVLCMPHNPLCELGGIGEHLEALVFQSCRAI